MSNKNTWNDRYLNRDIPWETGISHPEMMRLFEHYINKGQRVLEIGCGIGTNANWLHRAGYDVTGIDISEEAIDIAKNINESVTFLCMDFLDATSKLSSFPVIFDCAVLQVLKEEQRKHFVKMVANHCEKNGYWINISCSKDEAEIIENQTNVKAPPYLTASKIVTVVEPLFEVIEMKRCRFDINRKDTGSASFNAWASVFKKRL